MTSTRLYHYYPSSDWSRMPALTSSNREYYPRYSSTSTNTSYHASTLPRNARSSSVPRSPVSRGRIGSNFTSTASVPSRSNVTAKVGRALPVGPGPLDSSGKKISHFTVQAPSSTSIRDFKTRSSNSISANGPLRADHSGTSSYSTSYGTSHGSSGSTATLPRERPSSGMRSRRSSSIVSLSDKTSAIKIEDDVDRYTPRSRLSDTHDVTRTSKRDQYELDRDRERRRSLITDSSSVEPKESGNKDSDFFEKNFSSSSSRLTGPAHEKESSLPPTGRKYENGVDSPSRSLAGRSLSNSYTSSMVNSRYLNAGKTGLRNLGNTCFMNSVLQCLSNTKPLIEFCLNEEFQTEKNMTISSMKGQLITAYANLMSSMWKDKDDSYISPSSFKMQIQKFAPRFTGYAQQDAQEFLRYLLEGLHEDVNRIRSKPKPVTIKDEDFSTDSEKAQEYYRVYLSYDNSRIVEIFVGQLKSELRFKDCGHKSTTFDPFWDLSVPIPKRGSQVSIQQCINLFMKEEELDHDERPTCEQCRKRKACTKSFSIQKFPQILVLHLKRFSQGRYSQKVSTCVDFPSSLDMTDYAAEKGSPRVVYTLYAVSNHIGSVYSGHYTAYCKHPYSNEWNSFNDTRVSSTSASTVTSSEAYVLFYELSSNQKSARL